MHMRMETELLVPGMQDHRDTQGCVEPTPSKRLQRRCCTAKEQSKHHTGSESRQRPQLGRQRKDDVEVWNVEQALSLPVDPLLLCERLALRTMPIATRVVGGMLKAAALTDIEMSAERR